MKTKKYFLLILFSISLLGCSSMGQKDTKENKKIAIQLYSLRDLVQSVGGGENISSLLDSLAKIGYTSIEAAGYSDGKFYGLTPERFKELVEGAGMEVLSSHTGKNLTSQEIETGDYSESLAWWDVAIKAHKDASMKYIITPWLNRPQTLKELQAHCNFYNEVGKRCVAAGLKYGYHNHDHELKEVEDKIMLDYMIENTNPNYVFYQMDVYWMVMGKASPVDYFKRYPNRFTVLHLKDRRELGQSGMVGFDAIFNNLDVAGVKDMVVEVEHYSYTDVLKSIDESYNYFLNCIF